MPLIETNSSDPNAFGMGTLAPHADPKKFRSLWAAVDGENDGRWPSLREAEEGLRVGNDGRYKLPFESYKGGKTNNAYHEVTVGKVKLREMIVPLADAEAKDKYEGQCSTRVLENFQSALEEKTAATKGRADLSTSYETHQ